MVGNKSTPNWRRCKKLALEEFVKQTQGKHAKAINLRRNEIT